MTEEIRARKLRFMRFGLTVVVAVAFAVSAVLFYLTLAPLNALGQVFLWTVIITLVTAIVSAAVYFAYRAYLGQGD